jgi:hypothetical protein
MKECIFHNILQARANRLFSTVAKSIQDPTPRWILVIFKLKFCWKKCFPLIVTSIVQWRNFEITIEATIETIINLLWLVLQKEITLGNSGTLFVYVHACGGHLEAFHGYLARSWWLWELGLEGGLVWHSTRNVGCSRLQPLLSRPCYFWWHPSERYLVELMVCPLPFHVC